MIDIRYHSVSLVAVFMMLGVGIIIGLNLATPAQKQQTKALKSLQQRVEGAVQDGQEAKRRLLHVEHAVDVLRGRVVPGKLAGKRVEIIICGDYPAAAHGAATAVTDAGATSVAQIDITDKLVQISPEDRLNLFVQTLQPPPAATTPPESVNQTELLQPLMRALQEGTQYSLLDASHLSTLENEGYLTITGDITQPCNLFIVIGGRNDDGIPSAESVADSESAIVDGLTHSGLDVSVVGCEPSDALVSSIPNFQKEQIATVDCIDQPLGQLDLPFALRGGVDKADYGLKGTASRELPTSLEEQIHP